VESRQVDEVTMQHESTFRIVLAIGLVTLLSISGWHRRRARTGERLDRRQEGLALAVSLRLAGAAHLLGLLAYIVRPQSLAWAAVPLPSSLRWSGAAIGLAACVLVTWTLHHLGSNLTDTVVTRERHTLVTTGPYRWIRHPFYVGVAFAVLANALVAASGFLAVTGGVWFALIVRRTRREEAFLLARFGDPYRQYLGRTGRFLPQRVR
jgi:protein-S-isoprenylcysteine O-methyltransferase Ste14